MKRMGKRLAMRGACVVGTDAAARQLRRRELLVVNYHGLQLDESRRRAWLLLPRRRFMEQLAYLARCYRVLPVDAAIAALRAGRLAEPTACITFDDGYRNNLTIGLPILRELGLPATIYLATGLIGTDARLWTTRLELAFADTSVDRVDLGAIGMGVERLGHPQRDAAARARLGYRVKERLKSRPALERLTLVAEVLAALDARAPDDGGDFAFMDWDQVAQMGATGLVTFGGHTVHHEIVSRLDDEAVEHEISASVERARATGYGSETFAYPNGGVDDFDERAASALGRTGISTAFTTIDGLNAATTPPYAMRRVVVGADMSFDAFRLRVSGVASALSRSGSMADAAE